MTEPAPSASSADTFLTVAVSSRALFDLDAADRVFREQGLEAYQKYKIKHENDPLAPGESFALVRKLLAINKRLDRRRVDVILLSRNSADTGLRVFNSIAKHDLNIMRAAFRSGESPYLYAKPFGCDLFLSTEAGDVAQARENGVAAATLLDAGGWSGDRPAADSETLKIAFDFSWADAETILANGASACLPDLDPLPGGAAATGPRTAIAPCPKPLAESHGAPIPALRLRLGTAIDQIAIAPGEPTGAWKENGQAFFEYTPADAVPLSATVHSGRYATADTTWRGVAIRAHHHPAHAHLAARMLAHGTAALAASAAPQTGRWLHVVEVPDYTPLHRPPALLGFPRRVPTPPPTTPATGVLRYSEHAPMAVSKVARWRTWTYLRSGARRRPCRTRGRDVSYTHSHSAIARFDKPAPHAVACCVRCRTLGKDGVHV